MRSPFCLGVVVWVVLDSFQEIAIGAKGKVCDRIFEDCLLKFEVLERKKAKAKHWIFLGFVGGWRVCKKCTPWFVG
jgi:hypothetical protein